MRNDLIQEFPVSSQYFAPRRKERLMFLGEQISQRHITFRDRLIGIVGDAGSGKSSLIKGMFPGLELSNDDDMLNPRKIMQVRSMFEDVSDSATTYHIDMRFQTAFTQMHEIVDFVNQMLERGKRIIVEHFDVLYTALGINADIIIGIGEEIIVVRPNIFGPLPGSIYDIVHTSLKYRKMAHTLEDITLLILAEDFGVKHENLLSSDIRKGFVLKFDEKINIDFDKLSDRIHEKISENIPVSYLNEDHIQIGDRVIECNGPRFHVKNTSEIEEFFLVKKFMKDPKSNAYCLIGLIGNGVENLENRNTLYFLKRKS